MIPSGRRYITYMRKSWLLPYVPSLTARCGLPSRTGGYSQKRHFPWTCPMTSAFCSSAPYYVEFCRAGHLPRIPKTTELSGRGGPRHDTGVMI